MSAVPPANRILLVYQMAKVASMSWILLGRQHFGVVEPFHVHYMAAENLAFLRAQYEAVGPSQTILRRLLLRNLLQTGDRVRSLLAEPGAQTRPVLLVTGMRDPIARSASLLFFVADFTGRKPGALSWRDGAAFADVERAFVAMWEQVLSAEEPTDTFARVLHFLVGAYRWWFDRELARVLGIDLGQFSFPPGPARRLITQGWTRVLIYRVEDMAEDSPGHSFLRSDVQAVCGATIPYFPMQNATGLRKSGDFYRSFVNGLRMPARLIDRIYEDRIVRQFYTSEEIARFRRRWLAGPQA
jgi:hypothetical protein